MASVIIFESVYMVNAFLNIVITFIFLQSNSGQNVPPICGIMTGQHIYVDLGALPSDSATLNFGFTGTSTARLWDIKVAQIPCGANYA